MHCTMMCLQLFVTVRHGMPWLGSQKSLARQSQLARKRRNDGDYLHVSSRTGLSNETGEKLLPRIVYPPHHSKQPSLLFLKEEMEGRLTKPPHILWVVQVMIPLGVVVKVAVSVIAVSIWPVSAVVMELYLTSLGRVGQLGYCLKSAHAVTRSTGISREST